MNTYNITIDMLDNYSGIDAISLVNNPAVNYDFLTFNKDVLLQFTNEAKHIITGVAILADTPILRIRENGEFYKIIFEKDVIRQIVEKYSFYNLNNNVNIEHNDNAFVSEVTMIESYIIDKERGICPIEFRDVTDGSWIVSYKVNNNEVWEKIKNGDVKGFSVQGIFSLKEEMFSDVNDEKEILDLIQKIKDKIK